MTLGSKWPKVFIVILHWKEYDCTRKCLESVQAITYPNYYVIVVDNHSGDGSAERLQSEFPKCHFLFNDANLGFSRGCNVGIRFAMEHGADYALLLNNDAEVSLDFLEPAVFTAESDSKIGLVGGKILRRTDKTIIWYAGGYIDPLRGQAVVRGFGEFDRGQYDRPGPTRFVTGAMMLIRRKVIETVGLLPQEYFFGYEEWDYSTTVRKAGFKLHYVPQFVSYHEGAGSFWPLDPRFTYISFRSKMIYQQKHLPAMLWPVWRLLFWLYLRLWWPQRAKTACRGVQDYRFLVRAALMAFNDHCGIVRLEERDLLEGGRRLGYSTECKLA